MLHAALIWPQRGRRTTSYMHYTHCVMRQREPLTSGKITSKHYWGSDSFIRAQQSCKCYLSSDETRWIGSHVHKIPQRASRFVLIFTTISRRLYSLAKPIRLHYEHTKSSKRVPLFLRTHYTYHVIQFTNVFASAVNVFADMYRRYQRMIFRPYVLSVFVKMGLFSNFCIIR